MVRLGGVPQLTVVSRARPEERGWVWVSMKPGMRARSWASMCGVPSGASAATWVLEPTAVMRSFWTRTASARGLVGSRVMARALVMRRLVMWGRVVEAG